MTSLIDPTAASFQHLTPAPRRTLRSGAKLALVDSMANSRAGWGTALLDAAATVLGSRFDFHDVRRIQDGVHDPDAFARAMAPLYAALVVAVGD